MGLTVHSVGSASIDRGLTVEKRRPDDLVIALAGNPNVGKSTVFNRLTGMHQHTGNWPGKTVACAQGYFERDGHGAVLVDIPGCYSLLARSPEEEVARDFICFGGADKTVVVCDATCLERNLALVLQTAEITENCILCINLMDEAKRKRIRIDTDRLQKILHLPVVTAAARSGKGLKNLCRTVVQNTDGSPCSVKYPEPVEEVIRILTPAIEAPCRSCGIRPRWLALRLMDGDSTLKESIAAHFGISPEDPEISRAILDADTYLAVNGIDRRALCDMIAAAAVRQAEQIARQVVRRTGETDRKDRRIDRIITGKFSAFPIMFLLLAGIFWLTIAGANIPSEWLNRIFSAAEEWLFQNGLRWGMPQVLCDALFHGVFRVLAWVVSVMLPPMAIFFPLFTLLEDVGFLPRVAFNLDRAFSGCHACGKQALTTCMGFGCNAAGIVGCRIIDSPRERLIAMLTNVFVPCNGRFPGLISMITMFFIFGTSGLRSGLLSALILTALILLGLGVTLLCARILSATVLKGMPSSFTLELPPYRRPQILRVLVRSIFDRTLFVLSRAVAVAAPAGLVIWLCANITVGGTALLRYMTDFLDPFARFFGLDGVILTAFILGFPANEIVIPILLMSYLSNGTLLDIGNLSAIRTVLTDNGWTVLTALNFMLFSLMHFPCSTTLITVKKESGSWKWTAFAAVLPTAVGLLFCLLTTVLFRLFG